ncbi:MAG TPA: deoxyribonuclease IV, partial [Acidobacteriota bacterium]|nr:deoxyribonuclease IV [Acidobacteriota bacterium]
RWEANPLDEEDCTLYRRARDLTGIEPVVAHNSYLINLASPEPWLYEKSLAALVEEMRRASLLGVSSVILHPGAHMGSGEEQGIARVAAALSRALEEVGPPMRILLENTSGQGTSLGYRFEHLASIFERIRQPARMGVCLDTCHLFAAGYDIRTGEGYSRTMREFDRLLGIELIAAIHTNDSRKDFACRVDRHTHIGKGFIGLEAFRCIVNDRRLANVPKILETPKGDGLRLDRMNLAVLRRLVGR